MYSKYSFLFVWEAYISAIWRYGVSIVVIAMGTSNVPLFAVFADLFLYCCERDFMSDMHESKRYDPKDMFNDTSRYLDDILTIDNP